MSAFSRRIWLTGASSGIGHALAERLLKEGHLLALSARREEPLQVLAERFPGRVLVLPGDLGEPADVDAIAARLAEQWGALDCAILNAGVYEHVDASNFEADALARVMRGNLFSASHCIVAALPLLRRGQAPHLVGVASAVTYLPLPGAGAFGAAKAAVRYLLESLRVDLAREGIAVTVVTPGFVDTAHSENSGYSTPMRWSADKAARHIAKRLQARPLEIAFPGPFIAALGLLGRLPARLRLALSRRLLRSERDIS
ncbi:SDR family NAD(P)-dependent oxidoreductase [Pseudomonas sp. CNPSo 3701]|uniref:SDR family NAD(P)-dependent oxidoreductase n=1 Tax=Pseudomonas sp. CNPSo 3701 TaxID=3027943 RepID=UPI0023641302|nr:SDR family NAD(P)-dependent oxidoreductase [Pseudomonas sp. CNPSo 3701]MDD1509580.1 SDR family NAD(P)-dependent oxidoreductase [Pseudomonas sp. CNPSo 3701]